LVDVEKDLNQVKENLNDYITKDFIQDESNEFIFVKNSEYQKD
jgi:hypothetical protein